MALEEGGATGPTDVHTLAEEGQPLQLVSEKLPETMFMPTQHMTMPSHPEDLRGHDGCLWPRRWPQSSSTRPTPLPPSADAWGKLFIKQMFILSRSMH